MTPRERVSVAVQTVKDGSLWTWNTVVVCWQWTLAPLVDQWHGLSLTRFISIFCCVIVGHEIFVHEHGLTGVDFWLIIAAIGTAFGKMTFEAVLQRLGLQSKSLDITEKVDVTLRQIQERREHGKEWDAEAS